MPEPGDLAMPFLLISAFRGLVEAVHDDLSEAGFPGVQTRHGFAMQAIAGGCTSVELGQRLGVTKQAATKTARSLEDLGLIERVPHGEDRRALILRPTTRGRRMLAISAESFQRHISAWRQRCGNHAIDVTMGALAQADPGTRGPLDLSDWS